MAKMARNHSLPFILLSAAIAKPVHNPTLPIRARQNQQHPSPQLLPTSLGTSSSIFDYQSKTVLAGIRFRLCLLLSALTSSTRDRQPIRANDNTSTPSASRQQQPIHPTHLDQDPPATARTPQTSDFRFRQKQPLAPDINTTTGPHKGLAGTGRRALDYGVHRKSSFLR